MKPKYFALIFVILIYLAVASHLAYLFLEESGKPKSADKFNSSKLVYFSDISGALNISPDFENILDKFYPNEIFPDEYSKIRWIDKANAMYLSYRYNFSKARLLYDENSRDIIFFLKNGEKFFFKESLMLPEKDVSADEHFLGYLYYEYIKSDLVFEEYPLFFSTFVTDRFTNYAFFDSIYGKDKREIEENFNYFKMNKFKFQINGKNKCAYRFSKALSEINREIDGNEDIKLWFKNLRSVSSYSRREVAYQKRPSLHSWAIAIDISPRTYGKELYWYWTSKFRDYWWTIPEEDKARFPQKIIEIFEKHGFCWGGKWKRYDLMHFEYRPEIFFRKYN
ncbi:MAG TPA: M15 family metallopeptidase [Spirochaetota bacterium]|nr:M15 family metallopeptidase [Spirochaetota bacterium]HQF76683.1 M15 family metallopeptidase [Spirochaetota bacterium]